jgi:hypothetical protein
MRDSDSDLGQGDGIGGGTYDVAEALHCAQNLARNLDWHVFPCRATKAPATPHGFRDASKDADIITELWRRYPGPLVGIATGSASNLAVLDLDMKHSEALRWWRDNESRLPVTRSFRTRSGGVHLYFQHAPGVRCSVGRPVPGIDARGDSGYVLHWFAAGFPALDESPLAPWPAWLTAALAPPRTPAPPPAIRASDAAIDAIVGKVANAQPGTRNCVAYWGASRLRARGVSRPQAEALLLCAALAAGLLPDETRRTIASAWRGAR